MDQLANPNEVKKYYRKAMLLCHPDRIQASDDPDKIYIANRCFAALTDAFNIFKVMILVNCVERRKYKLMKVNDQLRVMIN